VDESLPVREPDKFGEILDYPLAILEKKSVCVCFQKAAKAELSGVVREDEGGAFLRGEEF
jgi:hypothetical protein